MLKCRLQFRANSLFSLFLSSFSLQSESGRSFYRQGHVGGSFRGGCVPPLPPPFCMMKCMLKYMPKNACLNACSKCELKCMLKRMLPTRNAGSRTALSAPLAPLKCTFKCALKCKLKCMLNTRFNPGRTLSSLSFSPLFLYRVRAAEVSIGRVTWGGSS